MSGEVKEARAAIEVVAGVLPGTPEPEYTKRWAITSEEWHGREDTDLASSRMTLLAERNGQALGYAALLMASPSQLNWVRVDWIWF